MRHEDEQPFRRSGGLSYGTSIGSFGYWLLQLLDKLSPSQWAAIGVLASILFGLLKYLTNLYFKIKDDRRKEDRDNGYQQD